MIHKIKTKDFRIRGAGIRAGALENIQVDNLSIVNRRSSFVNQQGSALIVTILLVTILVAVVVNFVYEVYIDSSTLSNWGNAQRASYIAKSGQALSAQFLHIVNQYSYTDERELQLPVEKDFGDNTALIIIIEDENAKFNINSIINERGNTDEAALASLKKLFKYLNINPDLSLIIADWIDPDSEPRLTYSEDSVKNTFLWSVDELKLIEGIDKDTFDKISPHMTININTGSSSYDKININTASLPVLASLHKDMTETLAQNIIDYREDYPFENASDIINVPGMNEIGTYLLGKTITVKSTNFRIVSKATVNEITRIIESVIDTSMNVRFWREA